MENIKKSFARCRADKRPALVTYVTAGYPTKESTVDILLSFQRGGADLIELGIPYSDPIADGETITKASMIALSNGVTIESTFRAVKDARSRGLQIPVLFMGYYNPILSYGEKRLLNDAQKAGVDGFIIVDLPPEEAVRLRNYCTEAGLSYIPLISPATSESRMKMLCNIADSFIYVVSRMSVTGSTTGILNTDLPKLLERVHTWSGGIPAAVGFGVQTREHYLSIASIAEGVVIGSQVIRELSQAPPGMEGQAVERYCRKILGHEDSSNRLTREIGIIESLAEAREPSGSVTKANVVITAAETGGHTNDLVGQLEAVDAGSPDSLHMRFGEYGGQYVPEALVDCLAELEIGFQKATNDPKFWEDFRSYYSYMGRPSPLQYASRLTEHVGAGRIYLKREDLLHTGSHKINNAIGQILLARRLGKTEIIAETGAGQHGVATATVCAKFGMGCTIYMGAEDVRRQSLNVFRMKLLGAKVVAVDAGSRTLRDAVNECLRNWVTSLSTTHYIIGSVIGPHPFPTIVRTFQSVIGEETKAQMLQLRGKLPDTVVACVGGGSNASGMFSPFVENSTVKLLGVEAGGEGLDSLRHAATLSGGTKGVLHGVKTYILQDKHGQVSNTHSISAGLDYPGVGPELASWKDSKRVTYTTATDAQALQGFKMLSELEGLIPALETSHAVWGAIDCAKRTSRNEDIVICLSGRGDKDVQTVADELPKLGPQIGWDLRF